MNYVLATFNRSKARELMALLTGPGRRIQPLYEFPGTSAPPEVGMSLIENARLKAEAAVRLTDLPAIADDTGLEVDALDGAPGARAARFAGPGCSAAENVALLLQRLKDVPMEQRTARFRTVCIACFPDEREYVGQGVLEGLITQEPRGTGGFAYDPVFEVVGLGVTLAELDDAGKNALSHRAAAVHELIKVLPVR
jgi:XTP/dITP diphosphohydrolase